MGSWLTKSLVDEGASVVGLQRDVVPQSAFSLFGLHDCVSIVNGSVEDYDVVERALNDHDIDTVFHLAAQALVGT